jgi:ATP-dependent Lhr-like helicase
VLGGYQADDGALYGKVVVNGDQFRVASKRVARQYYLNIGTISDDYAVKVVTRNQRRLGEVEESFVAALPPGEGFVIGGKAVVLKSLYQDTAVVETANGERVHTPRWMGGKMSLTARLAREEVALRRGLREAWQEGRKEGCAAYLRKDWGARADTAERTAEYVRRQCQAAPVPVDAPVQVERVVRGRARLIVFHVVAGRAVNRSLAWVLGRRLGEDIGSVVSNFIDQGFVLSLNKKRDPSLDELRAGFSPMRWRETLREALETTETLGRRFRPIAETGQLLARRTIKGPARARMASWNGSLLYQTFLKYEPDHPLVRETVREVMQDELDVEAAAREAERIYEAEWEVVDLPRPSPFALPLFSLFNREIVLAQDPDKALDELVGEMYAAWE